jgi:hypothetical protein
MIESNLEDEEDHQQPAPEAEVAKVSWNNCYFQIFSIVSNFLYI